MLRIINDIVRRITLKRKLSESQSGNRTEIFSIEKSTQRELLIVEYVLDSKFFGRLCNEKADE